ncbi:A-kinase anchor protein 14-like [Watersipora subatra]|uniref:A-kinase anchor protein 14-like n=1 Tax=Watersipora subatra TaxID=2589382 RepID=UPI00355C17B0
MSKVQFETFESEDTEFSNTAAKLVNDAINDAIRQLEKTFAEEFGFTLADPASVKEQLEDRLNDIDRSTTPLLVNTNQPTQNIQNIQWMTIDQFGKEVAESMIDEFIRTTWKYEKSWLYCVDYLGEKEEKYDMRYNFRVRWSIPTRRKPIPRATASVYFTFSVSKIKPGSYPVDVFYVFETNQLVHRPGKSIFREKWLKDIIESKIQLYETMAF